MRIAFVTPYDTGDVTQASGTGYHIAHALTDNGFDLVRIGSLRYQLNPINIAHHLFNRFVLRKNDHAHRNTGFLKHFARQVARRVKESDVELVVGSGGLPLAYLEVDLPIVLWTDCTFASLVNYYSKWCNLSRRTLRDGQAAEQSLFDRCDWVIMTSQWAADSAVNDYHFDPDRITIIPRGANLPDLRTWEETSPLIDARSPECCRLLFAGIYWKRKRGDLVLEAARILNERGIPTELTIIGCDEKATGPLPDFARNLGYVSKATPEGRRRFAEVLGSSHFLVLPTRADCTPIVLCEANAFGVPSISTHTGAVPSVVHDGRNGLLVDVDAPASEYADRIAEYVTDPDRYTTLCRTSFEEYETRLNWKISGQRAAEVLRKIPTLPQRRAHPTE